MSFLELPRLGETMEEGEIVAWLKKPGDAVKRGETIAEIQTDKIVAEMPALEDFVLEEILVKDGETVKVGQALARIHKANEGSSFKPKNEIPAPLANTAQAISTVSQLATLERLGRVRASPAARRLARELDVDISSINGTGPHDRITSSDIQNAVNSVGALLAAPSTAPSTANNLELNLFSFNRTQIATGKITSKSKLEIPHFYLRTKVNMTRFLFELEFLKSRGMSLTVNDAILRAVALALKLHPKLNASLEGDGLRLHPNVHIGVMTATAEGLVTSVIRDADNLNLTQINARVRNIKAKISSGRAKSQDITGATFCISNLGMFGVEEFSAIILPPNVAILAVGSILEEVIAQDGAIRVAKTVRLTLSADHRALDGAEVALFLQSLRDILEEAKTIFN
jgi:pyruvate dehydrogenase E2 component (dihydrolipoamide acetyltransferase)